MKIFVDITFWKLRINIAYSKCNDPWCFKNLFRHSHRVGYPYLGEEPRSIHKGALLRGSGQAVWKTLYYCDKHFKEATAGLIATPAEVATKQVAMNKFKQEEAAFHRLLNSLDPTKKTN